MKQADLIINNDGTAELETIETILLVLAYPKVRQFESVNAAVIFAERNNIDINYTVVEMAEIVE